MDKKALSKFNPPLWSNDGIDEPGMYILDQSGQDIDIVQIVNKLVRNGASKDIQSLLSLLRIHWHETDPTKANWISLVSLISQGIEKLHDQSVVEPLTSYLSWLLDWLSDDEDWTDTTYYSALSKQLNYITRQPDGQYKMHEGTLEGIICPLLRVLHQYRPEGFLELLIRLYDVVQTTFMDMLHHGNLYVNATLVPTLQMMTEYASESEVLIALEKSLKYDESYLHLMYLQAIVKHPIESEEHYVLVEILTKAQDIIYLEPWKTLRRGIITMAHVMESGIHPPHGKILVRVEGDYTIFHLYLYSKTDKRDYHRLVKKLKDRILTYGFKVWWDLREDIEWRTYAPVAELLKNDSTWLELERLEFEYMTRSEMKEFDKERLSF